MSDDVGDGIHTSILEPAGEPRFGRFPRSVVASWGVLVFLTLASLAGLTTGGAATTSSGCCVAPPSRAHLLGTAASGRDLVIAVSEGLGTSASIAVLAVLVALALGVCWGALAAVLPPRPERWMMRVVDVLSAVPYTLFVITLVVITRAALPRLPSLSALSDGRVLVLFAVASIEWLTLARVVHARIAALRRRPFIEIARSLGLSRLRILRVHLVPHTAGPLLAYGVLALPNALATEGFLSFLGFGMDAPAVSLGTLIADGARAMSVAPLSFLLPAGVLVAATVALHVVGAHLRDALRPERLGR
jgi:ABC-type dipeptide/oligopeptide/nickel transport system permease subunit